MQELFTAIPVAVFISASILVGLRLVHLHRRTGDAPELLLGLTNLIVVGIGYPVSIAGQLSGPEIGRIASVVASLTLCVGSSLLFLFTWRVFRNQEAWGRTLAYAGVVGSVIWAVWRCFQLLTRDDVPALDQGALVGMMLAFLWAGWESLRSYGMMRKRMRIGLGDAVVCDRFMLFGVWAFSSIAGVVINVVALWMHVDLLNTAWIQVTSSLVGLFQGGVMVLAFAPPRSYVDWVRARPRAWAS